jgi:hypothetical protein
MRRLVPTLAVLLAAGSAPAQPPSDEGAPSVSLVLPSALMEKLGVADGKKLEDFGKVTKGAKETDGLFKLYQKDENLYLEIRPDQFDKPLLAPIAIARGMGMGGYTLNFDEQWVLVFKHVGDKIQLIRRNVHFRAKPGSAVAHAVEVTYTDSILKALPIVTINPMKQAPLINLNEIFMTDFAQLGGFSFGSLDTSRSTWGKVKGFPKNIELEVNAVFSGSGFFFRDDSSIDSRGTQVVIHYGLCELPDGGYQPRVADDRVGHFLSVVKDFSTDNKDSTFVRFVNRWRLEPSEPIDDKKPHKLVAPKKKIVFWIEKSVPEEYRAYVREGILEWNKAFEKVGFRDAVEVRQQENEDFDPEDINYNTFRWITTDGGFAMGPSRANPLTGELMDADIIFDASMVRFYKLEAKLLATGANEPSSHIQAARYGYGLPRLPLTGASGGPAWNDRAGTVGVGPVDVRDRLRMIRNGFCQCASHKQLEIGFAAMAVAASDKTKDDKDKAIEELVGQAIKEVTMHEVGHTLGLRHNFKASTMLKNEQLHDTDITHKQGLVGSVMDYSPVNLAPKGVKQGDYFTTTIGPYDYWAIEYAYKPLSGGTEGEVKDLEKIASKCPQAGLDYGTDEDMMTPDPTVNAFDLGADPMQYGKDRMAMADSMMKDLVEKAVEKGEGYQRLRSAFSLLLGCYGNGAYLASNYIGGMYVRRDHRGDPKGRDPMEAVPATKQREALQFLKERILTDKPYRFPPDLLKKLAADRWLHWGNEYGFYSGVEYPLYSRILNIQKIALNQMFDAEVMSRIQNNALQSTNGDSPLTLAEVFRAGTDSVWADLVTQDAPAEGAVIRRNLQREHLKKLTTLVVGNKSRADDYFYFVFSFGNRTPPPDARSLARMHLRELGKKIDTVLKENKLDDARRAHLEECQEQITKVLAASVQGND